MTPETDEIESLLTAYALGELDAPGRVRVAALLEADAASRRFVDEMRETAGLVTAGLGLEQSDGLGLLHREVIERRLRETADAAERSRRQQHAYAASPLRVRNWLPLAASIAASAAIVCGTMVYLAPRAGPDAPTAAGSPALTQPADDARGGPAVVGPAERVDAPAPPGVDDPTDSSVEPREFATRDDSEHDDLDEAWEPVEGMVDPREFAADREQPRQEQELARRDAVSDTETVAENKATPAAPGEAAVAQNSPSTPAVPAVVAEPTKVARGPAPSPEAEVVRAGDKAKTNAPKQRGARRGVFVSPPRDPQAFERAKADAAAAARQARVFENPFRTTAARPASSFPVRVESSAYRFVRTSVSAGDLPPAHRVRIEELVNRFAYNYPAPAEDGLPLAVSVEVATCPWDVGHRLARVAVKAREGGATVVARGVEVSLQFNPEATDAWRLIGYENNSGRGQQPVPAFDLTSGDTATALYEIIPAAGAEPRTVGAVATTDPKNLFTVAVRFRDPQDGAAHKVEATAADSGDGFDRATNDFRFASAVAAFGMILRDSQFKGTATHPDVIRWATAGKGDDATGERAAFIDLAKAARDLTK